MDSEDSSLISEVKIEIDIAEEPVVWRTELDKQELKHSQQVDDGWTHSPIETSGIGINFPVSTGDNYSRKKTTRKGMPRKWVKRPTATNPPLSGNRQASHNVSVPQKPAIITATPPLQGKLHVCQHCSTAYIQLRSLEIHIASSHSDKLHALCPDLSRPNGGVGSHGDVKGEGKTDQVNQYMCEVCSKAFTQSGDLEKHKRVHAVHKAFACCVCSKAFAHAGDLERHIRIHSGYRPFVCSVCSKAFTQTGSLERHKRTHTGNKPFVCGVCNKAFADSGTLRTHKLIHTGEKPFVCHLCEAAFSRSQRLQRHVSSVHAGEKPHVCDICGSAFSHACHLKTHKRVHTGERPYVCKYCGKCFSFTASLKRHQRIHTGERPCKCPFCPAAFIQSQQLKVHIQRLHQ